MWVKEVTSAQVRVGAFAERNPDSMEAMQEVFFLERPYIVWPTYQSPEMRDRGDDGTKYPTPITLNRVHVSRSGDHTVHIARPELIHPDFLPRSRTSYHRS